MDKTFLPTDVANLMAKPDQPGPSAPVPDNAHLHLHYTSPSTGWDQALPVGNGRLGAMVHCRTDTELLQLNEDSVWYGGPQDRTPRDALRNLPLLRRLIRDGQHAEAEELVRTAFFATPASMRHYEPLGSAYIEFGHQDISEYRRRLDLSRAVCETEYMFRRSTGSTDVGSELLKVKRQVTASYPDNVLLMRVTTSRKVRFIIRLNRVSDIEWETNEFLDSIRAENNQILLEATPGGKGSVRLALVLGVYCDDAGDDCSIKTVGNCLIVNSAACTIAISAQTTYRVADPAKTASEVVTKALLQSWQTLFERHVTDYRSLFDRVRLRIWNPSFTPPWGAKFTININIQMNYWPVAACNLFECALPLISLLERMAKRGRETARLVYGCNGWCAHHNTDIWADTNTQDRWMPATLWPLAGVWVCIDMMKLVRERYDRRLHERLAPLLEGCVEFLLDFLVPSECGRYLVTSPSLSPENTFATNDKPGTFCEGSTIDMAIVDMAFEYFLWTVAKLYGGHHALANRVEAVTLPPVQINDEGLIQEWGLNNYGEVEPGHRHVSHLFGLYPGNTVRSEAEMKAAKKVLDKRAAHGGGHTGWSRAWLLNLHARLGEAERCGKHMELLLRNSTLPNMLDNHPPFQIDGNFGGCAGILECLARRWDAAHHEAGVTLLPACPKGWSYGKVMGLHIRDGWTISFQWKNGKVVDPVVAHNIEDMDYDIAVEYPDGRIAIARGAGKHKIVYEDAKLKKGM
ncbi:hypothetical protein VPNG_10225 [Cytospora leucostoma]|uniref:Uncharacterized protein n=1 Tax=Cytospora leucostoma TaxID=1230097 RepID=A0A423VCM9_9PEZI|nr:hypothetical protein VPNG_10225 [Cytospora leucostoma]